MVRIFTALLIVHCLVPVSLADEPTFKREESWDVVFIEKGKVGHSHTVVEKKEVDGKEMIHTQEDSVLSIKRFGQTIEIKTTYHSYETLEGVLKRIVHESIASTKKQVTTGVIGDGVIKLTLETPGKKTTEEVKWDPEVIGPYAQDLLLKKGGIKPGEKKSFKVFMPDLNKIMVATIEGSELEEVELLDGTKRKLQRVIAEIEGFAFMKQTHWITDKGDTLKTHADFLNMETYEVTKEVALAKPEALAGDFGVSSLVRVKQSIPNAYNLTEAQFALELDGPDAFEIIPQDDRQSLSKNDAGEIVLTIRAVDPSPSDEAKPVDKKFTESNGFLQSEDDRVVAAAKEAVGDSNDPWEKAQKLERWVYEKMTEKNFSVAFASAAEVAENLEGDCTEHGVLLAAMARAAGIPSRVAVGLIYAGPLQAFGYHMWTEMYINGKWVPMDATLGIGHASPVHIKIADSSLDGVSAGAATSIPVGQLFGKLKLRVLSWKNPAEKKKKTKNKKGRKKNNKKKDDTPGK